MANGNKIDRTKFYADLKEKLEKQHSFPTLYMFKFIVPNDNHKLALVEALFGEEAQVTIRESSKGKFVSVTGKEEMVDVDSIIDRYQKAEKIEGIVSL
jgi:putative lipoic acid-binding regulatory protein